MQRKHRPTGRLYAAAVGILLAALAAGCGSDDKDDGGGTDKDTSDPLTDYVGALMRARDKAKAVKCMANLHALGTVLRAYALSNGNKFPASLDDLAKAGLLPNRSLLICPSSEGKAYVYIPPRPGNVPHKAILVRDAGPVHRGQVNVLLVDGSIETISPAEVDRRAKGQ
jgi:prepilin-type processing-associated H-X9-DG protein